MLTNEMMACSRVTEQDTEYIPQDSEGKVSSHFGPSRSKSPASVSKESVWIPTCTIHMYINNLIAKHNQTRDNTFDVVLLCTEYIHT